MLIARDLVKRYGALTAVNGVSLDIRQGEAYGLLGPNGAGKSTTIGMLIGLSKPDAGSVVIDGESITLKPDSVKRKVGFVPQDLALVEEISARANLQFFGGLNNLEGNSLEARVDYALAVSGLEQRDKDAVKKFSGGMKRRLNIAVALLHKPQLLVLDEPTVGVDPQSRNAIFDALSNLKAEGMTILYTTHYMEEVEKLCQRAAIIDAGKLLAVDTIPNLKSLLPTSHLKLRSSADKQNELLDALNGAGIRTTTESSGALSIESIDLGKDLESVLSVANARRIPILEIESSSASLEQVFLHLTGRSLRD